MQRSLWISKTGLEAQQTQMDVISNNLANVGTNGFKKSRAVFQDLLYQTIYQPGAQSSQQTMYPSGMQLGTGVQPIAAERIMTQGNLQQTGNALDVAINGNGFFQVLMPNGTIAYTRDGSFQTDNAGNLVTASGFLIQPAITVPLNATSVTIGQDGTVSATLAGVFTPLQIGSIQLATFMNPTNLQAIGGNLYDQTQSSGAPNLITPGLNGAGTLNQGYVETSNVSVVEELVNMIEAQRAFEINSQSVQASGQMLQTLATMR
ncbi:MAG: flagellar basal-body rod protein FlgG [Betaproteobacteria bacterium]|jgi:flagellar basal-body rod protein FlgG, Gram-negative bacteria|nr:flagellar basal-body rod protein FlgG [Betaproteobacteria bacterium]